MTEPKLLWNRAETAEAMGISAKTFDRKFRHRKGFPKDIEGWWYSKAILEWLEQERETV